MAFIFPPEALVAVPVVRTNDAIAVRRVYCVGRNYAAHAREMGFDPDREPPFFFCKPDNAVVPVGYNETLALDYPPETQNYQYEAELVAVIGKRGADIPLKEALDYVWGYAVGLDMTRRDLQMKMREMGRPWEIGKAFDRSAPIGPIHPAASVGHIEKADLWLSVNGETKQKSNVTQLIWSVAETVAYLSRFFRLEPGDLIYTGTPEGVGPVKPGDTMKVGVERLGELTVKIA
ncbi:fumarylacetoacetate (FAA) hydrolase family protein [Paraburkholderia xenovorans LB400]|jgi:fumarylpyruvate hydrolase|uniref:Fumarylpyruvate hydrolase (MhbH) n=1 Tax=Paraburkholderia xenovorans (strain LB400) TaxID=266265 RepID=Q13ZY4_PARXL|nr:fumarylacetoacetate hydrolase family protein [Paraburkholderia xenovorans]ABE30325.1 Putative fumarylpyruvate hydrolase (MhbH) [Paraburkholderia xenovorans LB400]ABE30355.1 Putative fumarylpyruvate hydrolase (MhbH) [Paraburkholderia xenovorans LB400]AIP31574.1 fumarylacetoacetate (FAA) hydrolase family protein [Paraburkholderia xenovorans LB400]